ncbi:MAG TPA: hypothetical protein VI248_18535 [Kineosporiaceae bacterium]
MSATAIGALAAAGVMGAAVLAGPVANSRAASGVLRGSYYNGGFCYQHKVGEENPYRLRVFEASYDPTAESTELVFMVQKWDGSSNQYNDERLAFKDAVFKLSLGGYYKDANTFCDSVTIDRAARYLGGDVYRYGEWTSTRTIG